MERIKISIGKTYNLGNYESLRLDVGIELEEEEVSDLTVKAIKEDVETMLSKLEKEHGVK